MDHAEIRQVMQEIQERLDRLEAALAPGKQAPQVAVLDRIRPTVAAYYGVTSEQIAGPSRVAKVSLARSVVCFLERTLANCTYTEIGRRIGRDHTSVMYLVGRVAKGESAIKHQVEQIKELLKR